jgi:hypothetical protein
MSNNSILGGYLNEINNSNGCTIINGSSNQIVGGNNVHILGDNVQVYGGNDFVNGSAENDNKFYIGCANGILVDGPIYANGNITSEGDVVAFSSSDERLKDDVQIITSCLDKVLSLDAIEFDWNTDLQSTYSGHDIGLIAQQVQQIAPEIVVERDNGYLAMKYEKIIPLLIGATQEQDQQISELEKQVQELIDKSNH